MDGRLGADVIAHAVLVKHLPKAAFHHGRCAACWEHFSAKTQSSAKNKEVTLSKFELGYHSISSAKSII